MIARDMGESKCKYTLPLGCRRSRFLHCRLSPGQIHSVRYDLHGTIFLSVHIRRCSVGQVQIRPSMMDFKSPLVTVSRRNDPVCSGQSMQDATFSRAVMVLIVEMSLDQSYLT